MNCQFDLVVVVAKKLAFSSTYMIFIIYSNYKRHY